MNPDLAIETRRNLPEVPDFLIETDILIQAIKEVHFGMPSKDCRNLGICTIVSITNSDYLSKDPTSEKGIAILSLRSNHTITCHFIKSSIRKETYEKHFSSPVFTVLESIQIPAELAPYRRIKVGQYPIERSPFFFKVEFELV